MSKKQKRAKRETMKHLLPKGTLMRIMDPLEMCAGGFKVSTDEGFPVNFVTFAIEFAFPMPKGADAMAKLEKIQRKIEDYVQKGNRSTK